jgi:hypothetical protein
MLWSVVRCCILITSHIVTRLLSVVLSPFDPLHYSGSIASILDRALGTEKVVTRQQRRQRIMAPPTNSNESYCTFTLASDVTAGGLPSEAEIAKDLESNDDNVSFRIVKSHRRLFTKFLTLIM